MLINETANDEQKSIISNKAREFKVIPDIHEADFIYKFVIGAIPNFNDAINYYFKDGKESAQKLCTILTEYGLLSEETKLLEFASGYGCVTRHFANCLPKISITSCDIHEEAIKFIQNKIGYPAILSKSVPEELQLNGGYDVIFALSFFSHMPKVTWERWLKVLVSSLKEDGLMIFTTHGMESRKHFNYPETDPDGFWFAPFSEQADLQTVEYGQTIVNNAYVFNAVGKIQGEIICYKHAFWWGHQDLYIVRKVKNKNIIDLKNKITSTKLSFISRIVKIFS